MTTRRRRRRFGALQAALFLAPTIVAVDDHDVPWVPRHAVLRRHLQGPPAFVVGALGNVGMPVPDNKDDSANDEDDNKAMQQFTEALASRALDFFRGQDDDDKAFLFDDKKKKKENTFMQQQQQHKCVHETLQWTGEFRRSRDGGAHARFQQYFDDLPVQGGNLVVHTDGVGNMVAVNGEYVDCRQVLSSTTTKLLPDDALSVALVSAGIPADDIFSQTAPTLALVVSNDLSCCLAYQSNVAYWGEDEENGGHVSKEDILYANAFHGGLCARDPLVFGSFASPPLSLRMQQKRIPNTNVSSSWFHATPFLRRSLVANVTQTNAENDSPEPEAKISSYYCSPLTDDTSTPPQTGDCELVSISSSPISTGNVPLDSAHNFALATFNYFLFFHGLNSLDGQGYELISYVLSDEFQLANAYWNGFQMTYGYGDDRFWPLSQAADVVAHELTHGVTQYSSRLIYANESGALNEAMSDIFGALIERQAVGTSGEDVWLIGEAIMKNGGAIRNMSDPSLKGHYDYYPDRYQGDRDNGGVHWNSGIANLAFKLLVTGGTHPQGVTDVDVTGLIEIFNDDEDMAFAVAGEVFFCANSECLTRHSTFDDARHCTATICGSTGMPEDPLVVNSIHNAWYAVGVGEEPPPLPTSVPTQAPTRLPTMQPTPPLVDESITFSPTHEPTDVPSNHPSRIPSISPSASPSQWTRQPTSNPTRVPTAPPSASPTYRPTLFPTHIPTSVPTLSPTRKPAVAPTSEPTLEPTWTPTMTPSAFPSNLPTLRPTMVPSLLPTYHPSSGPTTNSTSGPTLSPSFTPTRSPFITEFRTTPSFQPTLSPTSGPSSRPTNSPTLINAPALTSQPTFVSKGAGTEKPSPTPPGLVEGDGITTAAPSPALGGEQGASSPYPTRDKVSPTPALDIPSSSSPPTPLRNTDAPTDGSPRSPTLVLPAKPTLAPTENRPNIFGSNTSPSLSPSYFASTTIPMTTAPFSMDPETESTSKGTNDDNSNKKNIPWKWVVVWSVLAVLAVGLGIQLLFRLQKELA